MAVHATHSYDVLIVGAGGAGLRAAIEAAAAGVSVGLICKSLLGKAHTVMAEGGIAAAHGQRGRSRQLEGALRRHDARRPVREQLADGGAARAARRPTRVRELEAWGAVFDRTPDGRILQRNFGGHRYPRLAHVGDRTGLELIRTLQDHTIHLGVDRPHGAHRRRPAARRRPRRGRARLRSRARAVPRVRCEGRRARDRRRGPRVPDHEQQLGRHRRRPRARLPRRRRAHRHGVRAVPSRPAWCGRRACAASW